MNLICHIRQIFGTIKKGFPEKGMVPFGTIYKDNQLKDVVNFIMSRQEGLRELKYQIFHDMDSTTDMKKTDWPKLKANKSGMLNPPYIDFNIPEVDKYAMRFQGNLIVPESGSYEISCEVR